VLEIIVRVTGLLVAKNSQSLIANVFRESGIWIKGNLPIRWRKTDNKKITDCLVSSDEIPQSLCSFGMK